ncbi:MAG: YbdK family carboxylate-amine ligase [Proteobacteria bacterium]|nr:YbdK family carboxylate-amine ligase [Pseudomonadota bacterium]
MEFNCCSEPSVGVEWELQLVAAQSLDLFDGILPLMKFFPDTEFVKPECIQSCVELTSCIADTSETAVKHIEQSLSRTLHRCSELEMSVIGAGTHPFCRRLALITPTERYMRIEESAGYLAHTQITFSTHVHIGMRSGNEAMRAMSRLIPALPAFIALSANSPFWRGHETGHAAYRHRILAAARNYGLPVAFRDWSDFKGFYRAALKSGMIRSFKGIHWDIRPHPDFGTLEIRTMDAASDLQTLRALTAFARVMTVCMARAEEDEVSRVLALELPAWIEKENCYRASQCALNAEIIYNKKGDHRPLRGLTEDLISFCEPIAEELGESKNLGLARQILLAEPGYTRQLEIFSENRSTAAVTKDLESRLLNEGQAIFVAPDNTACQ